MAPQTRNRADNEEHVAIGLHAAQRASAGFIVTDGTVMSPEVVDYINVPGIYMEIRKTFSS